MTIPRFTTAELIATLQEFDGCVVFAAKKLQVATSTIYARIAKSPKLKELMNNFRKETVDLAEMSLRMSVLAQQGWAVCFTLKTLGRAQGLPYNDNMNIEVSGPGGGPIQQHSTLTVQAIIGQLNGNEDFQEFARQRLLETPDEAVAIQADPSGNGNGSTGSHPSLPGGNGQSHPDIGPDSGNGQK